jgi:hypothetical protein
MLDLIGVACSLAKVKSESVRKVDTYTDSDPRANLVNRGEGEDSSSEDEVS